MGLDMYLTAKRYIWQSDERDNGIQEKLNEAMNGDLPEGMRVNEVSVNAMYWRKANAIHNWFVEKCQNGIDECQETRIAREQLKKLVATCKAVLADKSKAHKLLPCASGFFFGNTNYDEFYFEDLEYTKGVLEKYMKEDVSEWNPHFAGSRTTVRPQK